MDRLLPNLVHSFRRLARAPGFTVIAILTLALGIGANTAIFSLVKTVVLRALPYGDPDRLMMIWASRDKGETTWIAGPEILSYATDASVFEHVAAYTGSTANLTGGQEPERVISAWVTPNLFQTLGVRAQVGRTFTATDSASAIADNVILGYGLWTRRFGSRPEIVGQTIHVNGRARLVIGIMPASFKLPLDFSNERPSELWVPTDLREWTSWGDHSLIGVTYCLVGYRASMTYFGTRLRSGYPWCCTTARIRTGRARSCPSRKANGRKTFSSPVSPRTFIA